MVELAGPGWLDEPELLGVIPWKTGALGSLVAGWDGELEVDVPLGFVVGEPPKKVELLLFGALKLNGVEGLPPWKTGALGSLVAGWDGELEVDVPLGFVVGNPPWKTGAFGSELAGWEGELVGVNGFA